VPGRRRKVDSPHLEAAATLARNVRIVRGERGWSQQKLAERAGVAYGTVRAIETRAVIDPGVFTVQAIAQVLDVTIADLLRRHVTTEPSPGHSAAPR